MKDSMESRIPVPTDNVYKFYALFSLLVLVFSMGAIIYSNKATNDLVFNALVELEALKAGGEPPALTAARKSVLERRVEVASSDHDFVVNVLSAFSGFAICGIYYGFAKWHKEVQPVIDETAKVQLDIAKLQLEKLRRELSAAQSDADASAGT